MSLPRATAAELRLSADPRLVFYRDPHVADGLVAERSDTRERWVIAAPEQIELLFHAANGLPRSELLAWGEDQLRLSAAEAQVAVDTLVGEGLLLPADDQDAEAFAATLERWQRYGWLDAFRYVTATRDIDFLDYADPSHLEIDSRRMAEYSETEPRPSIYKRYPSRPFTPLERDITALDAVDLGRLLVDDLDETPPGSGELSTRALSTLLLFTLGQTGTIELPDQGELLLKAVPSGGARHPIEGYLMTVDAELGAGTYHYSVERHGLEAIAALPSSDERAAMLPELLSGPRFAPKAILLLTAKLERPMWRYRDDPRSFRVVLHDAGHVLEQVKLVARALGLVAYVASGLAERRLGPWLGIDDDECLLDYVLIA